MKFLSLIVTALGSACLLLSCESDWLDAKPDKALILPVTIDDYQLLLNNRMVFGVQAPALGEAASDDAYLAYTRWLASPSAISKNVYIWSEDIYEGEVNGDWNTAYSQILNANVVLEGIAKIRPGTTAETQKWQSVKGQALFYRAWCFYNLSQIFCKPYDPNTAGKELGLPLKLSADVNERPGRSSLQQTYDQITGDLLSAKELLPETQEFKTQPTKNAVSGLLARIYLSMEYYTEALSFSKESLLINNGLMNYYELNAATTYPMPLFNKEVIWHAESGYYSNAPNYYGIVDTVLYGMYSDNDLRKTLFFGNGTDGRRFRGNYKGTRLDPFVGIANDELFLIAAECSVRIGSISEGMQLLNTLLKTRWKLNTDGTSTFTNKTAANETEALKTILDERRKELILRGVRWSDLRRLNRDERFRKTLLRHMNGQTYSLPPNDPRYTFLIPPEEIRNGNIEQTVR